MTYFPLLIVLTETNKTIIVASPDEIPNGVVFRVVKCNYTGA